MGEIVSEILVYNSITNTTGDEKLDANAPFSLIEFLNYTGSLEKSVEELELYNNYLRKWQSTSSIKLTDIKADIKTQFTAFLSEVKLLYSSAEEKRYLDNINLQNEEQLSIAIPFFARKIKEISQYFTKKRQEMGKDLQFTKSKGSNLGLIESIKNELLDLYSGDGLVEGLAIPSDIGLFIDGLSIEIENKYDAFNDYYDLDPQKSPTFYDTISGDRFNYFTSNTNEISGAFFYDTEQAIKDIINTQGVVLKEIPNLLIDYDNTDINTLPDTYFRDYKNTGSSNLKYILQAELVQKFMGTDMYFISSNSANDVLSGKMFDAQFPYRNLLNINNPSVIQVPGDDFKTSREVGLFYRPTKHNILKIDAAFEPVLSRRTIEPETVYMFPDPSRYGKVTGVGESARESPFIFVLKDLEFKNNSSSYGRSLVKSSSDNQNFYSYSSLEQDNFTQNNETPLHGIESGELSGNIFKEVGDIYGNTFFLINPTTIANRNIANTGTQFTVTGASNPQYNTTYVFNSKNLRYESIANPASEFFIQIPSVSRWLFVYERTNTALASVSATSPGTTNWTGTYASTFTFSEARDGPFQETPLDIAPTEFITLTADERNTIDTNKRAVKNILLYNTLKDSYQTVESALSGVFSKYIYDAAVYNELNSAIIDIDIFKNTFFIRTSNHLIIDNIIYNQDSTFASKIFVSRVKKISPGIVVSQDSTRISNISNPLRLGSQIFTIKVESSETTSPINSRTFNFSIFKYNLDTQTEVNVIDENTTNRSYFAENFTFDVGSNIVQVRDMKLSFNKKQNKFFLLTDFADLNNVDHYHVLVFEIKGNKLKITKNFVIGPTNNNTTSNFYKNSELADNFTTQTLSSTPTQIASNGTLNL
jgi:hypothetical protein